MIPMKKKKWLLLIIPAVLILAAALVWFLYLSPRMALSNAADDALSKLEQRLKESPVPILAKGYDESGRNSTSLELTVSDGVQYDMQVQTDLTANQILADGTIRIDGKTLNLSAYLDKEFAAITSEDLFRGGYYGITYDTFSSDVRSFPLLSRLIPSATLSKLDSSVEKLQVYMNRTRQIPQLPEVQEEDIHKLILGLLVLKSDVHKETLTVDGQSLECLCFDYSATGEQAGTLLGYLMDTGGLSQGDITASFYLCDKTLVAVRCDGRAGENRAALRLDLGQDAARGDVSIAVEKLENGKKSAFSYKIGAREADGAHTESIAFGAQSIFYDWRPQTGDMVLTLPEKSPISLNLSQAQDGFQIQTKDFAALIGINSRKGFDSTMTVRKGTAITPPNYKNLDEWSLDDLLVLLGSIGGLLGFK